MTREEAITIIGNLEDKDILFNPCDVQDAKTMAIQALEQEPFMNKPCVSHQVCHEDKVKVLDKIRTEIEHKAHSGQWSDATMYGMLKAVAIIDKYRVESEDEE